MNRQRIQDFVFMIFFHRQVVITAEKMGNIMQMSKNLDDGCITKKQKTRSNGKEKC